MNVSQPRRLCPEEYLEAESTSPMRHEYIDGHLYAMAGGSDDHNQAGGNL